MRDIQLLDTTLRDGEQGPGITLTPPEKVKLALAIEKLGADVIEVGFPASSAGELEGAKAAASALTKATPCVLCRCMGSDIDAGFKALDGLPKQRIHLFLAVSDLHMEYKLHKTREEILRMAERAVKYAASSGAVVQFSPEDCTRADRNFLCEVLQTVIDAGANVLNITDTVGWCLPEEYADIIRDAVSLTLGKNVIVSTHCHNDLGLATANTIAGLRAGASQAEGCVNGIGERAGNAALEEIIMTLKLKGAEYGLSTHANAEEIFRTSTRASRYTGVPIAANKPVVGANAFLHESGIHQHGIMSHPGTYAIMQPEDVGMHKDSIVLGKHSGRHAFTEKLHELGYSLDEITVDELFEQFKKLADTKADIETRDIEALVDSVTEAVPETYRLERYQLQSGMGILPTASVAVIQNSTTGVNTELTEAAVGDGPIDAVFRAIERCTGLHAKLLNYDLTAITGGNDAQAEAKVRILYSGNTYIGRGISTDIIKATARAYINALNRAVYAEKEHISAAIR